MADLDGAPRYDGKTRSEYSKGETDLMIRFAVMESRFDQRMDHMDGNLERGTARFEKLESEAQERREESILLRHDLRAFKWFAGIILGLLAACMPFALSHLYWA